MNEYENQPADDASGEIPRPTIDDYEAPETDNAEDDGPGWAAPTSEPVDVTATESAPSHALRRTLIFAGAATAAGLLIGTGVAVARSGSDHRPESASESSRDDARTPATVDGAVNAAHFDADGDGRGPDGPGGHHGRDRDGRGGAHGDHAMPGSDQGATGSWQAQPPTGGQPGNAPSSSSHGS